jgi:hypothetical protein
MHSSKTIARPCKGECPEVALTAASRRAVTSLLTEVKQPNSPVALTGVRDPFLT